MWFALTTILVICFTYWTYKWRNPRCNGTLPPGSMGFPLVGETVQFLIPANSLDILPFFKKRIQSKYGTLFRTSLAGRQVVVSADPEVNNFILQEEGRLVEMWYLDSYAELFCQDGSTNSTGYIHKYLRNLIFTHFGPASLKGNLLPKVEDLVLQTLHAWSTQQSLEVKHAISTMIFDFTAMELFSYDPTDFSKNLGESFINFTSGLISFPLNIPGTTFHKCCKNQKKTLKIMREIIEERLISSETRQGDLLALVIEGMKDELFLTENFIVYMMFGLLFASFESIPTTLALAIKLLTDHPFVLQELKDEHEAILKRRQHLNSKLTWEEYKSMTFTFQVINEILRVANVGPGILRRTLKDVNIKGYTIPAGWSIMVVSSATHMDPNTFSDPLAFNPGRWKNKVEAKKFMPFGGGIRTCAGAELSKLFMAVFIHGLATKYRWSEIGAAKITRNPILGFPSGFHIKVSEK